MKSDLVDLQERTEKLINSRKKIEKSWRETRKVFFDVQRTLLGMVTPPLRKVWMPIETEEKKIDLYFCYDGNVSAKEHKYANFVAKNGARSLANFSLHTHVDRVDWPERILTEGRKIICKQLPPKGGSFQLTRVADSGWFTDSPT